MYCPQCGAKNADDARACGNCGAFFPGAEPPRPAAPRPRPDASGQPYPSYPPAQPVYAPAQPRRNPTQTVLWVLAGVLSLVVIVLLVLLITGAHKRSAPEVQPVTPSPAEAWVIPSTPEIITPTPIPDPVVPVTVPPTLPPVTFVPVTPPPTLPSAQIPLGGEMLYRINIFLSNFSEQGVQSFTSATVADDYIIRVVELYCKINHPSLIVYQNGEECLSLADANTYLVRFFGRSVNPYEGAEYMLDAQHSFRYSAGYFRFPAADGEAYNRFTVAYEMLDNGDGSYTVSFQIFALDLGEYFDGGMDSGLYWLSNDEAASLVQAGRIAPVQGGTAVVTPYTFNGQNTFQIRSYQVWNLVT